MQTIKTLPLIAAFLLLSACASFNSGDIRARRPDLQRMMADKNAFAFSDISVSWKNFPNKTAMESIGEGSVSNPVQRVAVDVPYADMAWFRERAKDIFTEAGLYDVEHGSGTLRLTLMTFGRWTYKEIFKTFLVDTPYIFIIPASIHVNYYLTAEFTTGASKTKVEEIAKTKTTFHPLMIPLYPFFAPGAREHSLVKRMLWKASTDVYSQVKRALPSTPSAADVSQPQVIAPAEPQQPVTHPAQTHAAQQHADSPVPSQIDD